MSVVQQDAPRLTASGFPLVAGASALWGTDALFRRGLALDLPASSVVFYEHLILAVLLAPVLLKLPWRRLGRGDVVALILIGAGASALATGLFTASFRYGDPNTVLLLQKIQPLVAVAAGHLLLGEVLTPKYGVFFAVAAGSAWLITFPDPSVVSASTVAAAGLAAGAAVLWALGTVLGRRMSDRLSYTELTAARFGIGLPAAFVFAVVGPGRAESLAIDSGAVVPLLLLALVPGLLALLLYYRGLCRVPASLATLAELAFPASALLVNYLAFGAVLTRTQTVGVVALSATLVAMSVAGRGRADTLGVSVGSEGEGIDPSLAGTSSAR